MSRFVRSITLLSSFLLVTSCEKDLNISELTENDFFGSWEEHQVYQHEGVDSAHVTIDSIMSLINSGYDLYFNDGTPSYITFVNQNPSQANVEAVINGWFSIYAFTDDRDDVIDLISLGLIDGENIIRSSLPGRDFNDNLFRTYHHPNGGLELQRYREDVGWWVPLFATCYLSEFEKNKSFSYDCDRDSSRYRLKLEAINQDYTRVIKVRSLDTKEYTNKYYKFVR